MDNTKDASVLLKAFHCPHCRAFASQTWLHLIGENVTENDGLPLIWTEQEIEEHVKNEQASKRHQIRQYLKRMLVPIPVLSESINQHVCGCLIENTFLSICFSCKHPSIWIRDKLIYPSALPGIDPNQDMDPDIREDFNEAREILRRSPRSAAALLRLCIQKLCIQMGLPGKKIDDDIASLVKKGLDKRIQQALDIVRVTGNEAVHPGTMDLKDDHTTVAELFKLVNLIADQMISQPKRIQEMYLRLPPNKLKGIEERDSKS